MLSNTIPVPRGVVANIMEYLREDFWGKMIDRSCPHLIVRRAKLALRDFATFSSIKPGRQDVSHRGVNDSYEGYL